MTTDPGGPFGMVSPPDFPLASYQDVAARMALLKDRHEQEWKEFAGGWNGLLYRFMFVAEEDTLFTTSVKEYGSSPISPHRFVQEKALYVFIVSGFSALECLCYGVSAAASIPFPNTFQILRPGFRRDVSPESTVRWLRESCPDEALTGRLATVTVSDEYREWKELRNVLAHRSTPGRHFIVGGNTTWGEAVEIDEETTSDRRWWLAATCHELAAGTLDFCSRYL
jgi:hypothetical protein